MATSFVLDHLGARFQVKLTDCLNGSDIDISNVSEQFIVFRKPDGTKFEKVATLDADPENPSQIISITDIRGDGTSSTVTVTIPDTSVLENGEIMSISGTVNFNVTNVPLSIVDENKFTYDLETVGDATPETVGTVTTQGEFLITYTNTSPETVSILDLIGSWEYAGKVKLNNNDEFQTSESFVFWVK